MMIHPENSYQTEQAIFLGALPDPHQFVRWISRVKGFGVILLLLLRYRVNQAVYLLLVTGISHIVPFYMSHLSLLRCKLIYFGLHFVKFLRQSIILFIVLSKLLLS